MLVEIVRYSNRKYYSKSHGQYVKLVDILQYIREGCVVEVHEYSTKKDMTRDTLLKVLPYDKNITPYGIKTLIYQSTECN